MSSRREDLRVKEVPDVVTDPSTGKTYTKGRFLGKGGFAKCYELIDDATKAIYAGKVVSKALLVKPHQKDKMTMEIHIHRSLNHKHIVGFHSFFEDKDNVYVLLELCRRRSLMELHKRRHAITEPETRYFMRQCILGVQYLNKTKVIHRDLKLGNLFINDNMEIKIGDFGLATKVDYIGERKKTLCGTPNYIAPEVLSKKGHSYEVDIWSLGCIMYTMLVGKPPFETQSLKDTYMRIKRNEYRIPSSISSPARTLIQKLLRNDPSQRPTIEHLLEDPFFTSGYLPPQLPTTCLTMAPRFQVSVTSSRRPLLDVNCQDENKPPSQEEGGKPFRKGQGELKENHHQARSNPSPKEEHLAGLLTHLSALHQAKPSARSLIRMDEAEDPAAIPILWVSKWVDYSDKYGLGYQLCDGSVGVLFNDSTRLLLHANGDTLEYIERDGNEKYCRLEAYTPGLHKKVTLLRYFRNYMSEHLLKAGAAMTPRESDSMARLPFLQTWFRTKSAIILHLSNGTLQINFFEDHTKIILCPLMGAVTYIDQKRNFRTYRLNLLEKHGCTGDLNTRLDYALTMVQKMTTKKPGSATTKTTTTAAPTAVAAR
ncbi:serine/threonine-protein kinase PLK1-like [Diadema setosum]|uniref:serine/threonine-protein kinase PLK1-like n=1 Tax=Diadema setosum TaxID=31175 RepID=UPI003B3BB42E